MTPQKKDPNRVSVFIEDEFAFGVTAEVALRHGLKPGSVVSRADVEVVLRAESTGRAYDAALHLLGYRTRTAEELRRGLLRKGFGPEAVEEAVQRLTEQSYVDDRSYAVEYVSARVQSRGEGHYRIRGDLRRRGVSDVIIDEVLDGLEQQVDWLEVAQKVARKRWHQLATTEDERRRRKKLFDYLIRKGFDFSTARAVISDIEKEPE